MMSNNFKRIGLLLSGLIFLSSIFLTVIPTKAFVNEQVLIIADRLNPYSDNRSYIHILEETLCHFNITVDIVLEEYYEENMIEDYDVIFLVSLENEFSNKQLASDISNTSKRFVFVGEVGKDYYPKDALEISYLGESIKPNEYYKGNSAYSLIYFEQIQLVEPCYVEKIRYDGNNGKTIISLSDGNLHYPYLYKDSKHIYLEGLDIDTNLYYEFINVLYPLFDENTEESKETYFIIQNIRPYSNIRYIQEIIKRINEAGYRVMLEVTATFIDESTTFVTELDKDNEMISFLKHSSNQNIPIITNGYSYYDQSNNITYGRSEFWDMRADMAYTKDIDEYYLDRYKRALRLFWYEDLYPIGVSVSNDAISYKGYIIQKEMFSSVFGKIQASISDYNPYSLPLVISDSMFFTNLHPVVVNVDNDNAEKMYYELDKLIEGTSMIKDSVYGIGIEEDIKISNLENIISLLDTYNLRNYVFEKDIEWVRIDDIYYQRAKDGQSYIEGYNKEKDVVIRQRSLFMTVTNFLIVIIGSVCVFFLFIFIYSRRRSRKNLFLKQEDE